MVSLSSLQKNDSYPAKEIAIITLTRIYVLLHEYQALVREIASQTLSAFVTACLQLIRSPPSSKSGPAPVRLIETIANALCAITPLYPTTLRPFSAQMKAAFRTYLAPTASDKTVVPQTLRESSRKLFVLQHYTTPKNGNADEWAKSVELFLKSSHNTADHVFRAVQESWESSSGYTRQRVSYEEQPHGGSDAAESLPVWSGLSSGADRLIGLLETLGQFFKSPTKTSVTTPVSAILDLTARVTLIVPPSKGPKSQYEAQLNPAIGREEKDELWSVLPDIHTAVMGLLTALVRRLGDNVVPMAADMLHQTVRIFEADQHIPLIRERGYVLVKELLLLHGPTMSKLGVNSLDKAIQSCCRDLLAASGHAKPPPKDPKQSRPGKPVSSTKPSSNADAYLVMQSRSSAAAAAAGVLPLTHVEAASALLAYLPSQLPQQHLKQALRALVDRTAVLSHDRTAMVASVLNPYRTRTGKTLASLLPFLARDFPRDREVEVMRSNLRKGAPGAAGLGAAAEDGDDEEVLERMQKGSDEDEDDEEVEADEDGGEDDDNGEDDSMADAEAPKTGFDLASVEPLARESTLIVTESVKAAISGAGGVGGDSQETKTVMLSSTLKHKSEELEEPPSKRIDTGRAPEIIGGNKMDVDAGGDRGDSGSDSDSDVSVQLNAQLEDDDSEDEDAS